MNHMRSVSDCAITLVVILIKFLIRFEIVKILFYSTIFPFFLHLLVRLKLDFFLKQYFRYMVVTKALRSDMLHDEFL